MRRSEAIAVRCAIGDCSRPATVGKRCGRHFRAWLDKTPDSAVRLVEPLNPPAGTEYRKTLKASSGACEMCGKDGRRQVDHCHRHSLVRGFVCASCNMSMRAVDGGDGSGWAFRIEEYASYARRCPRCVKRVNRIVELAAEFEALIASTESRLAVIRLEIERLATAWQ